MRLVVIPLSLKRSMVYCQWDTKTATQGKPRIDERLVQRATSAWNNFSKSETKWKQKIVSWANAAMEKIPYDEWSLKTIPARSSVLRRLNSSVSNETTGQQVSTSAANGLNDKNLKAITVIYPKTCLSASVVRTRLEKLSSAGISYHTKYMWLSAIGAPLTLPVAIVPIVPNIPGFYLLYRAWSHWCALNGAKHLKFLTEGDHLSFENNVKLDELYQRLMKTHENNRSTEAAVNDETLLEEEHINELIEIIDAKDMMGELHRAIKQVDKMIKTDQFKEKDN